MLSQVGEKNTLQIFVWDSSLFVRASDLEPIAPLARFNVTIPKITEAELANTVDSYSTKATTGGMLGIVLLFMLNFVFNMGMNKVLSQVRNLSLVTHLMMMQLSYPGVLAIFFEKIFRFVTFDMIPTDEIYPRFLDLEGEPFSEEAD